MKKPLKRSWFPISITSVQKWVKSIFLDWDKFQFVSSLFLLLLIVLSPLVVKSPYYLNIIIATALFAFIGIAWNIVAGFAGQLFIGFATFVGLGAYTTIILINSFGISPWIGFVVSGFVSGFVGLLVSVLTLRYGLKNDYLALFTLALMTMLGIIFSKIDIAGGAMGIWISFKENSLSMMTFNSKIPYLYIVSGLLLFGIIVQYLIYQSRTGRYFLGIREDEDAAAASGIHTTLYKAIAIITGSMLAGVGGGFYVVYTKYISPFLVFGAPLNIEFLVAPIIGGRGTLLGPILGSLLNKPIAELVRGAFSAERGGVTLIVYGVFLMSFILFLPKGVTGLIRKLYEKIINRATHSS